MKGKILESNDISRPMRRNKFEEMVVQDYFSWLCDLTQVITEETSYLLLAKDLFNKDFYWFVPNDDNREKDGLKLRDTFAAEAGYNIYNALDNKPCSMLEMIMGLAIRINYMMEDLDNIDNSVKWFWHILKNLDLIRYSDDTYYAPGVYGKAKVDNILNIVLARKYKRNGDGGLFPLKNTKNDQRKVEIWYQLSEYLVENYYSE